MRTLAGMMLREMEKGRAWVGGGLTGRGICNALDVYQSLVEGRVMVSVCLSTHKRLLSASGSAAY